MSNTTSQRTVQPVFAVLVVLSLGLPCSGGEPGLPRQRTNIVVQTATFGPLILGGFNGPASVALPFRLTIPQVMTASGYRVAAASTFVFSPSNHWGGGKSITAADVGVGITGVAFTFGPSDNTSVVSGFDYDPAHATGGNGASPYTGATAGRATLADLFTSREVLRVGKNSAGKTSAGAGELILTVKLAVQPQFLTPGSFSGTISLTVSP